MDQPIRIEATLTKSDLRRWFIGRLVRRPMLWWFPLVFPLVGVGILFARAEDPSLVTPALAMQRYVSAFAFIATWMWVVTIALMLLSIARMRSDGMLLEPKRITIDDAGITCAGAVSTHVTAWQLVARLERRAVGLIFALRDPRGVSLLIPHRALDEATIAGIEALFARSRAT